MADIAGFEQRGEEAALTIGRPLAAGAGPARRAEEEEAGSSDRIEQKKPCVGKSCGGREG
ncbi:hypothetical protein [Sphingobium yanoikuyae]|jgi:hypothetical protein|uniref:hypothetical protein n=1 Tax=Sphingobium yanoikuyae TaxID=13690 RepID=UPI00399BE801